MVARPRGGEGAGPFTPARAAAIKDEPLDLPAVRAAGYGYERLDQLTMEILYGVR